MIEFHKNVRESSHRLNQESDSVTTSVVVGLTVHEDPGSTFWLPAEEVNN
jgi:hypothetical protein